VTIETVTSDLAALEHNVVAQLDAMAEAIHAARSDIPWEITSQRDVAYRDARAAMSVFTALTTQQAEIAALRAEVARKDEALAVAWKHATKMRKASELVGPYPNDRAKTAIWVRSLYHAGKDLMDAIKPFRAALAPKRVREGDEQQEDVT